MKIKICGVTRLEDAGLAASLGAWGIGFIFYPPSPRALSYACAAEIAAALPAGIEKVGVFVNPTREEIERAKHEAGITLAQLHGDETSEFARSLSLPYFKAYRRDAALAPFAGARGFLFDAPAGGKWGGTGQCADWSEARSLRARRDSESPSSLFFLAGGLTPENAGEAIMAVAPDGLDISSGVEDRPGIKSREKLERLFARIKLS